jgi:ABC-type multidrug transport system ATPase subunit
MWAMVVKESRQLRRDRRTLLLMIVMPVVLLIVFGYAASFEVSSIPTRVVGPQAEQIAGLLPAPFDVGEVDDEGTRADAENDLRDGVVPVVVLTGDNGVTMLLDGSELFTAQAARTALARLPDGLGVPTVDSEVLFNEDLKTSTVMVPGLAGLILLFIGTVITSLGVVRERQAGTLEQLTVMPLRPGDVFLGKIAPYFLVAAVDLAVVLGVGVGLFDVPFRGPVLVLALGSLLYLFVALGPGRADLLRLAEPGAGHPAGDGGAAPPGAPLRSHLSRGVDGTRRPLDLVPAAADLLHPDLPGRDDPGSRARGPLAALRLPHGPGARGGRAGHSPVPSGAGSRAHPAGAPPPRGASDRGGGRGMSWGATEVGVRFGHQMALEGVSLDVPAGQVTAVVGGDGAGKTTLLRALVGATPVDQGEVRRPDARRIGYLAASSGTYPELTVEENIEVAAGAYGVARADVRERASEYLERTGLADVRERFVGRLSGGMRQKVAVVRALLHRPDLVVLDEPTTGVDPVSRVDLWWLIARAAADGAAVVLTTSYLDEAERATTLLLLDAGRTLARGTTSDVVAAMPGTLWACSAPPGRDEQKRAWRRGREWRLWDPASSYGDGNAERRQIEPDLQDAVTVLALARETRAGSPW